MTARVTVVIITWQSCALLRQCLRSLAAGGHRMPVRIVVIDNASTDGTREMLRDECPEATVVVNRENRGVAPARNQGLALVETEFALLLDTDTIVHEGAIDRLVEAIDRHPSAGIAGGKLILPSGEVQDSCKRFPSILTPVLRRLDFLQWVRSLNAYRAQLMSEWAHDSTVEVDYVVGACQLIRRTVLDKIGLLDEKIRYGPEDIDFCLRARRAGWTTLYVHDAVFDHLYRRVTRSVFSRLTWWHVKGLVRFFLKNKYIGYPKLNS